MAENGKGQRGKRSTILIKKVIVDGEPLPPPGARERRQFALKVEEWLTDHVERQGLRSREDIRGVVDRDLKPAFADKTIDEITRREVTTALSAIGKRSGSAANNAHKWLRQMFNWLIEQGDIDQSPVAKVKKPFPEQSRERVLSLGELVVEWVALDRLAEPFRSFYRLAILLGRRLREGSNAPWSECDLDAGDWFLSSRRTKAKRDHIVPMPELAIELLEDIQPDPKKRSGPVFTMNGSVVPPRMSIPNSSNCHCEAVRSWISWRRAS